MSASREKHSRKVNPAPVVDTTAQKKSGNGGKKALISVGVVLAVLVIIFSLFLSSSLPYKMTTAITAGEHKISPAEYNYFYREVYYQMSQTYGDDLMSYLTDAVKESTLTRITDTCAIYDKAVAEGYTLSEEEQQSIDDEIGGLDITAATYGMPSANAMLTNMYGRGCNTDNYRAYREMVQLVSDYAADKDAELNVTDAEVDAYYKEHADEFNTLTYRQFLVPINDTMNAEQAQATATEMEEMIKSGDLLAFAEKAAELAPEENKQYYTDETAALVSDARISDISEDTAAWLTTSSRMSGDTTTIAAADGSGVYVVEFISTGNMDYDTVNVRHILVGVEDGADEAAKKTALETATSYLEEFNNGDKTEASFAALAEAHSDDEGSKNNGGLYENVAKGQMVEAFNNWIFDQRHTGDCDIVETPYGYHVIYFCGYGENYLTSTITTALKNEYTTKWTEELTEGYPVEENALGMRFVKATVG